MVSGSSTRILASRAPNGSSSSSTCGSWARARATATRCCWPPESWPGRRLAKTSSATSCSSSSRRRARALTLVTVAAVERNAAVIDVGQTGGNAQQRALAAATGPQEHEEFARFDLQRNVVDRRYAIATLGNL